MQSMKKEKRFDVRGFSVQEWNRVKLLAKIYAKGNISAWIRYSAINGERKFISDKKKKPAKV